MLATASPPGLGWVARALHSVRLVRRGILIWGSDRAKFGAPETKYKDAKVCVTGRVAHSSRVFAKDGLFVPRFLIQQSRAGTPGHKLSVIKVS